MEETQKILTIYRRTGEAAQIGELFKSHQHLVFGLCLHYLKDRTLAEDAVMDIFEHLLKKLRQHEVHSFRPWLMQVTRNHCLNKIQRHLSKIKSEEFEERHFPIMENGMEEGREKEEILRQIEEAITSLSPQQQQCIGLYYFKNMSYAEISEHTDFSIKEVKSHLQNGKEKLRRIVGKNS